MNKLSFFKLPYQITLVSLLLPLIASYFFIELHRIILLITVLLFTIYFVLLNRKMIFSKSNLIYVFFLLFLIVYDQIFGRGLFYFSHSHIIIYVFIFYHCLIFDENKITLEALIRQISFIYSFIIFFMILELFFHLTGNAHILYDTFSIGPNESIIQFYREYHNRFAKNIGLNIGALNSLILGNQIASQLMIYAMLWFFPFYYINNSSRRLKRSTVLFIFAATLFFLSPTMTANTLFIISIFVLVFMLPVSKINNLKGKIIFFLILFLGTAVFIRILFPIFFDGSTMIQENFGQKMSTLDYYLYGFTYPIFVFFEMPLWDQIFGRVHQGWAEFGYFKLLISAGALWTFTVTIALVIIISSAFRLTKNVKIKNKVSLSNIENQKTWIWIAQVNAFICLMYFLSLVHYITIFRLGAVQLFSLHIAVTMYATRKSKILRNYKWDINLMVN